MTPPADSLARPLEKDRAKQPANADWW